MLQELFVIREGNTDCVAPISSGCFRMMSLHAVSQKTLLEVGGQTHSSAGEPTNYPRKWRSPSTPESQFSVSQREPQRAHPAPLAPPTNHISTQAFSIVCFCTRFREALSQMKNAIGEGGKFKSRAKEELQTVSKKSVPKICILRVNFPNKQVLQVQFHPTETLQQVRDKIAPCLAPAYQGLNWYLYITPPLQRLTNFKSTLYKEGLCPGSSVYFGVEGVATAELSPPYMHPQLLANLPAEPPVTHVPERSLAEVQDMRMRQQEAALARANALAGNEGKPLPKF